jgi:hypothetical protein
MTTIEARVYVIYSLYFGKYYRFGPRDIQYYCAWWKCISEEERSNRGSVISIVQKDLYDYYMRTPLALQNLSGEDIIKFVMKHQFDNTLSRIKNFFWGVGAVVLKIIGGVLGVY